MKKQTVKQLKSALGAALFCINEVENAAAQHDPKKVRHVANKSIKEFRSFYKWLMVEKTAVKKAGLK